MAELRENPDHVVVVVDDDEVLRNGIIDSIKKLKLEVIGITSGNLAFLSIEDRFSKYGDHKVKLIISDWMMPDGDGIQLLNKIRANPGLASIPFLLMSGAVTKDQLQGAMKHDPDGILLKPFGTQVLPERMRAALDVRERKELERLLKKSDI